VIRDTEQFSWLLDSTRKKYIFRLSILWRVPATTPRQCLLFPLVFATGPCVVKGAQGFSLDPVGTKPPQLPDVAFHSPTIFRDSTQSIQQWRLIRIHTIFSTSNPIQCNEFTGRKKTAEPSRPRFKYAGIFRAVLPMLHLLLVRWADSDSKSVAGQRTSLRDFG